MKQNVFWSITILLLAICGNVAAYQPPVGIPDPSFGINETVASIYGSSTYYTYYVDNKHPDATDNNNPFGSPARPRSTVPSSLTAGDVVQIHGGPYTPPGDRFYINGMGTHEKPIIITGMNSSSKPVFEKKIHVTNAKYLIIEGIKVKPISPNREGIEIRPLNNSNRVSFVSVRRTEIQGDKSFKSYTSYSAHSPYADSRIHNIVFYDNLIYDNGHRNSIEEDDTASFSLQHNLDNIWVLNNTGHTSGGDGVILAHGAQFSTHHIYIGGNIFFDHRENGIDLKQANDVIVSENIIYGHRPTGSSSGEGIVIHYDPKRIWIINNIIYDCERGIVGTGSSDTHFIGNVVYNIRHTSTTYDSSSPYAPGAAIHVRNSSDVHIYNNTVYGYDGGILVVSSMPTSIKNNILMNRAEANSYDILYSGAIGSSTSDHNLFYPIIGKARIGWGSTTARTASEMMATFNQETGSIENNNPLFFNALSNNFSLSDESPAINKGVTPASYRHFEELYGINISRDIDNRSRVISTTIDIGAYEKEVKSPPKSTEIIIQ